MDELSFRLGSRGRVLITCYSCDAAVKQHDIAHRDQATRDDPNIRATKPEFPFFHLLAAFAHSRMGCV